jgi:hypothetical protein
MTSWGSKTPIKSKVWLEYRFKKLFNNIKIMLLQLKKASQKINLSQELNHWPLILLKTFNLSKKVTLGRLKWATTVFYRHVIWALYSNRWITTKWVKGETRSHSLNNLIKLSSKINKLQMNLKNYKLKNLNNRASLTVKARQKVQSRTSNFFLQKTSKINRFYLNRILSF